MKKLTMFLLLFLTVQSVFSQYEKKSGTSYSEIIQSPVADPVITEIVKNIKTARENNNIEAKLYWEGKLHELTNPQIINESPNASNFKRVDENQSVSEALNVIRITPSVVVANSISRERVKGDIYAALGVSGLANADTLKVYRSTNNGLNFNLVTIYTVMGLKITPNGVDVEAVSNGDSSYAFIAMSYTLSGDKSSIILRTRQDGAMTNSTGNMIGNATNKYTNIRVTSDNAKYTAATFIYVCVTLDSLVSGTRRLKSKLYRIESPFNSGLKMVSGYQSAVNGQYGYNVSGAAPDTAKFETDIAYVSSTVNDDILCTVTIVRGVPGSFGNGSSLYFTKSNDFGATAPTLFFTTDVLTYIKESPRFAATGLSNNSAIVVTRKLFGGGDWDPFYFYTSNITIGAPVFNFGYANSSSDTTLGVSVVANYRSNGSYLFAFNEKLGQFKSSVYIRPFTNGELGVFSTLTQVNNPLTNPGSNLNGLVDAGFRNVNNDSCLTIWGGTSGSGCYVTGGCSGPFIGINSSNTRTDGYELAQNYPNPFNPSTKINYTIPLRSSVSITVFDVLGKEIGNLVNEIQTAGNHSIEFNGVNLPSGVYYYKIEANDFIDTKKMILVK